MEVVEIVLCTSYSMLSIFSLHYILCAALPDSDYDASLRHVRVVKFNELNRDRF